VTTPSKTDLMYEIFYNPNFVPLPSPKVNVKVTVEDNKPSYLMKDHATGTYYHLDELTNFIWNLTDGKRTVTQIIEETQRQRPQVKERTILEIVLFFAECNLLVANLEPTPKKRFRVVSAFEVNFCLIEKSKDFLQSIYSRIRPVFKRPLLWVAVVYILISVILFAGEFVSIYGKKAYFEILGSSVVGFFFYYFVALAPVITIHEIAHGLALVHYGGQPGEMGTGLFYFGPMFYTETTDAWGLSRLHRMMVYLAGNLTTLFIGATIVFVRLLVAIPEPFSLVLMMVAFYCFSMSLFNFAPPFETDGYYILTDVVKMPNLRKDSYGYLGSTIKRALGIQTKTKIHGLTKRKKAILLGYAALSVAWIIYIVFQSSIFLMYMGQDVATALANVAQAVAANQVVSASVVIIAVASTLYFGMQIVGYGFVFSVAVKKATVKPLHAEAIHDRDLAVFAYLPPQVPEALSTSLRAKMEKVAKKFTPRFEVKQTGRSCVTVLRMGGTSLALVQIQEHLKEIENEFSSAYQNFITRHKESLQKSSGIYAPEKVKLTTMLNRMATESADMGNSAACSVVRLCEEKQNETLFYLLYSVFGTIWTIEANPAIGYDFEKEMKSGLLLEDLTFTDLYRDCEGFKKRVVYGFDSLAKLAAGIDASVRESLARPDEYQLVSAFEPIKSRILFVGRTEQIEKNIDAFVPLFVAQTWSGYLDNLLSETCFTLSTLNKARLPSVKDIKEMNVGELAVLKKDLAAFEENEKVVDTRLRETEIHLAKISQSLQELKAIPQSLKTYKVGSLDAAFQVNAENLEKLPIRIKEFQKEWTRLSKPIKRIRTLVETEHSERKSEMVRKKRKMLKIYPPAAALSVIFVLVGFQSGVQSLQLFLLAAATILQALYWVAFYRMWKSFHKVTRYPSQAFSRIHLFLLALTEAVYEYATIGDALTPL